MNYCNEISQCKGCGASLSEPASEPRTPCPVCGNIGRKYDRTVSDGVKVYDTQRMQGKHGGTGKPYFDARSGADFYFKDKEWRHLERVIDRDNDTYIEIITNMKTGELIKETREPLSDHQGHGSAKKSK